MASGRVVGRWRRPAGDLADLVLESTLSLRHFEIQVDSDNLAPMVYAPETQSGGFFNDQERNVRSYQWVEALSLTRNFF